MGEKSAAKILRMHLPLKAAMTGEDWLAIKSRSCAASAFFREHLSPVNMKNKYDGAEMWAE